ncbi:MAG TPA: hypothetical protein VL614_00200 [Acetobacteraceae bacterium]|jgi:hypothetical protein|nr:hypothetical protein [Acetobacteraceae bacterium]
MSQTTNSNDGPAIGALHEVRARFRDPDAMERAIEQLEVSGFNRADLSLPEAQPPLARATPDYGAKAPSDEADARQARTLHTSGAAAVAGMAAAGVVIATGGAAAPAVAAALVGGGLAGGAAFAVSSAANSSEQADRERKAASGTLILSVHAASKEKRGEAATILRSVGGMDVEVLDR